MSRLTVVSTALAAPKARLLLQLALLAVGLLTVSFGGGAPECAPDAGGC